jgi:hypothetical protein
LRSKNAGPLQVTLDIMFADSKDVYGAQQHKPLLEIEL